MRQGACEIVMSIILWATTKQSEKIMVQSNYVSSTDFPIYSGGSNSCRISNSKLNLQKKQTESG